MKTSPSKELFPFASPLLDHKSIEAPNAPNATPAAFKIVMGCLRKMALNTITRIGLLVMMMLAFTGEVSASPLKKRS